MKNKRTELNLKEEKVLLTFIQQTKEGKYVKIDESSFPYSRIKEQSDLRAGYGCANGRCKISWPF